MRNSDSRSRIRPSPRHRQNMLDPAATGKQYQQVQSRHAHRPTPAMYFQTLSCRHTEVYAVFSPLFSPIPQCTNICVHASREDFARTSTWSTHELGGYVHLVHVSGYPSSLLESYGHQISSSNLHANHKRNNIPSKSTSEHNQMNQHTFKYSFSSLHAPSQSCRFTAIPASFESTFFPALQSKCDHPRCR